MEGNKTEIITKFFEGRDKQERIVAVECGYDDEFVSVVFWNELGQKMIKKEDFRPFVWAKHSVAVRMFNGDRGLVRKRMNEFGIGVKALKTTMDGSESKLDRIQNGYRFLFYSTRRMSWSRFQEFFKFAGTPIYGNKKSQGGNKEFLAITPVEQHMMYTGKRMFKGYNNYDDIKRLVFDLETSGLNPEKDHIDQIGIRTNKGFETVLDVFGEGAEKGENELAAICKFFEIIAQEQPDVIAGQNSEKFDWFFIEERCKRLGTTMEEVSSRYFTYPIYKKKKEAVLKLGGEIEYYRPTVAWGFNMLDSLHAIRRAQASDSSMEKATLKYVTKYLHMEKKNRVYVNGNIIGKVWRDLEEHYAFNDVNGDWYEVTENKPIKEGYQLVSGQYVVKRYLLDDLYETDKVECKMNECNFLIGKMLPTTFQRACTMGTAGIWKLIILEWCLINGLAIPAFGENKRFTGGLSRLLRTGYVSKVIKLDYNSLYPSILLTFDILNEYDISGIMLNMLEYVLTQREKYKELKKKASKSSSAISDRIAKENITEELMLAKLLEEKNQFDAEETANDKKQLPLKTLGNSYFGANGCPSIFPLGNVVVAEKTTCIGRMQLRLMIYYFSNLGYNAIVGDSFTKDTPMFIKWDCDDSIEIVKVEDIFDADKSEIDSFGREYDYTKKGFKVLCRSGWVSPNYIYRHKTDKDLYRVKDGDAYCDVTSDHSLFDDGKNKIKPSDITDSVKLEYYKLESKGKAVANLDDTKLRLMAKVTMNRINENACVPKSVLNGDSETIEKYLKLLDELGFDFDKCNNKVLKAGVLFLRNILYGAVNK